MNQENQRKNPFFEPYNTPHDTAPFDRIHLEDFEEAFMEGIRRDNEQIEKIINNPEKPTFDNTIISVDDEKDNYYDLLSRTSSVFFNLLSAETNDEMDALAQKMSPILTKHANDIRLNERLFERFPEFDDLDDIFVESEEAWMDDIAHYIDDNLEKFATIK